MASEEANYTITQEPEYMASEKANYRNMDVKKRIIETWMLYIKTWRLSVVHISVFAIVVDNKG
jgi:hypothetical protein